MLQKVLLQFELCSPDSQGRILYDLTSIQRGFEKIYIINCSFSPIRSNFAFTLDDERRVNSYLCFSQTTYGSFCIFLSILVLCADKIYRFRIYLIFLVAVEIHSDFYIKSDQGSYTRKFLPLRFR